jgi:hypothetical protein
MYLIELTTGKEALYRSEDEFTAAIRRGEVGPTSRIYHRAASAWIPVTFHPHFRKIATERASGPAWPMPRKEWTFLQAEPGTEDAVAAVPQSAAPEAVLPATGPTRGWRSMFGRLVRHH